MKILFLGSVLEAEKCTQFLGPSVAGNKMQLGILKGLKKLNENITVVTEIPIATFPRENRILVKSDNINLADGLFARVVPFINVFFIKQCTLIISASYLLFDWSLRNRNEKKVIVTFNPYPYVSIPAILVSRIFKIKVVCIFADPPIDTVKRDYFGKILKYFEIKATEKILKEYNCIIALNKKAVEKYAPGIKYLIIDGGFDINEKPLNKPGGQWISYTKGDYINLLFSGGLYEYNGLINLIEAFNSLRNDKLKLSIYGEGPLKDFVIKSSIKDSRIAYCGNVPNNEMLLLQQKAGVLINPRPVSDPISLYTFPSKMIEYMLSGTPVITTKLNGLTPEYLENIFVMNDNSIEQIANSIETVIGLRKKYLVEKASAAREFIVNNKSWDIQSHKIYDFILDALLEEE